jgi:hypothetical protein
MRVEIEKRRRPRWYDPDYRWVVVPWWRRVYAKIKRLRRRFPTR